MFKVIVSGNVTRDPEQKSGTTKGGKEFTNAKFSIAAKTKKKNDVAFVDCTAWNGLATGVIMPYLKKGNFVVVMGSAEISEWEDADGNKRSKLAVTVEDFEFGGGNTNNKENTTSNPPESDEADDDVPF